MHFPPFKFDPSDKGYITAPDPTGTHPDIYIAELVDEDDQGRFEPDEDKRNAYGRLLAAAPALFDLADMVAPGNTESDQLESIARNVIYEILRQSSHVSPVNPVPQPSARQPCVRERDRLSELIEDPDAGNDDIRDAAIALLVALNEDEFSPPTQLITWIPVTTPPDEDTAVLIHCEDGSLGEAYLDMGDWFWSGAIPLEVPVTHWAHLPDPPPVPSIP